MYMGKKLIYIFLAVILLTWVSWYYVTKSSENGNENVRAAEENSSSGKVKSITIGTVADDAVKQIKGSSPLPTTLRLSLAITKLNMKEKSL